MARSSALALDHSMRRRLPIASWVLGDAGSVRPTPVL